MDELPEEAGAVDFFSVLGADGADLSEPEDEDPLDEDPPDEDSPDEPLDELLDDLPDELPDPSAFAAARESVR